MRVVNAISKVGKILHNILFLETAIHVKIMQPVKAFVHRQLFISGYVNCLYFCHYTIFFNLEEHNKSLKKSNCQS
jgi:hypothetical protein